jgi:hypothetical protein
MPKLLSLLRTALFLAFIGCLLVQSAGATVFINEDWDTGTPPANWPCKQAPSSCSSLSFNSWVNVGGDFCDGQSSYADDGLSTTRAHSGAKSFFMKRNGGSGEGQEGCDIRRDLPTHPTNIYVRIWLYLDTNYLAFNTPTSREPYQHFIFFNSAIANTGFQVNLLSRVPYVSTPACAAGYGGVGTSTPYMWFNVYGASGESTNDAPAGCYNLLDHVGQWQCIEWNFNASTKKMSVWVAGNKVVDNVTVNYPISRFNWIQFSPFMSDQDGSNFASSWYIDDVVVSDSRIGCGDTIVPSPPFLNE